MVANIIRLSVSIGCLLFGTIKIFNNDYYSAAALFFAASIILFSHFRNASIIAVVNYVKRGNYERAKKLLDVTPSVKLLSKNNKGYYYWSKAYIKINENDTKDVEEDLLKVIKYGLKDNNDLAMANASLAEIYIHKNEKEKAKKHLEEAIKLSDKEGFNKKLEKLKEKIK